MSELSQEVLKRIDTLAEKLGTTGEKLWEILVRQAYYEGMFSMGVCVASLVLFPILVWSCVRLVTLANEHESAAYGVPGLLCGFFAVLSLIAFLANVQGILMLFNPEYYAYKMLVGG